MVVECPDNQVAIETAKGMLDGKLLAVWNEARMILHLDPAHPE
jgi:hypothetical protein